MDKNKFNALVDQYLTPQLKSHLLKPFLVRARAGRVPRRKISEENTRLAIRPICEKCPDCDLMVENRVQEFWLERIGRPSQRWVKKCSGCGQKTTLNCPYKKSK